MGATYFLVISFATLYWNVGGADFRNEIKAIYSGDDKGYASYADGIAAKMRKIDEDISEKARSSSLRLAGVETAPKRVPAVNWPSSERISKVH
jgi:hypothetical protein